MIATNAPRLIVNLRSFNWKGASSSGVTMVEAFSWSTDSLLLLFGNVLSRYGCLPPKDSGCSDSVASHVKEPLTWIAFLSGSLVSMVYGSWISSAVKNSEMRPKPIRVSEKLERTDGKVFSGARMFYRMRSVAVVVWDDQDEQTLTICRQLKIIAILRSWPLRAYAIWDWD